MRGIELFAGAGGLGLGVSRAGFEHTCVVEWDRWCCDTLRENRRGEASPIHGWPEPIEDDVRHIDFQAYEGKVALVTGGPPCQPFSIGGKHRAHDDNRDMWPEAVRAIREVKPKAFIFENVKGLKRQTFATYFAYIIHQLTYPEVVRKNGEEWLQHLSRLERHHTGHKASIAGLMYRVAPRLLNAANFGVPQRRERVVFVGIRADLGIQWAFPQETHSLDALLWEQLHGDYWERNGVASRCRKIAPKLLQRARRLSQRPKSLPWLTVRDALAGLPDPQSEPAAAKGFWNHRFQPGARAYPGHSGSPLDEPAKTLKAGVHGVPGGENMLVKPDGSVRYFTVRESARLQTFPDDFIFHGAWSEAMRQLGNAVPVHLAEVIAKEVRNYLLPPTGARIH